MTEKVFRWGFIGCGKISSDFANALKNSKHAVLQACAARSLESAQSFARTHNFVQAYASYEQLVQDSNVDIVYIGTLHISHYEHTLLALTHHKHVLVEKPMTMNATQAAHVLSVARQHQCFCMEGMWTRFFPAVRYVRKLLRDDVIGIPHHVNADMGFFFEPDNQRMWDRTLGGGGLLDIGIYPLAFATMVFGGQPTSIHAVGQRSEQGVDVLGAITLQYPKNHQFATIQYSCIADFTENTTIIGTKGRILIHGPSHCPTKVTVQRSGAPEDVMLFPHPQAHPDATKFNFGGSTGLLYEAEAVMASIQRGELEHPEYSLHESLELEVIMDTIRKQLKVVYDSDK